MRKKMAEYWTCIECEGLFNDTDGDLDERMCNECFDKIHFEELKRGSNDTVKSVMDKVDKFISWVIEQRPRQRKNDGEPTTADEFNELWKESKEKNND